MSYDEMYYRTPYNLIKKMLSDLPSYDYDDDGEEGEFNEYKEENVKDLVSRLNTQIKQQGK